MPWAERSNRVKHKMCRRHEPPGISSRVSVRSVRFHTVVEGSLTVTANHCG